jgi:hypothetical protein
MDGKVNNHYIIFMLPKVMKYKKTSSLVGILFLHDDASPLTAGETNYFPVEETILFPSHCDISLFLTQTRALLGAFFEYSIPG